MPPIVTIPPSPLGDVSDIATVNAMSGNAADAGLGCGIEWGPWYVPGGKTGPAWYALTIDQNAIGIQIHKSMDDRATFHLLAEQFNVNLYGSRLPPTGTILYTTVVDRSDLPNKPIRLLTFDFSTEVFTEGPGSGNTDLTDSNCAQIVLQPSGTIWVFYDHLTGLPAAQTRYTTSIAGAWGTDNLLYAAIGGNSPPNVPVAAIVMEASGRFHGWISDGDIAVGANQYWKYFQVSALGVVGAVSTAFTIVTATDGQFKNGTHLAQIKGDQLFFPFSWTQSDNNIVMWCLVGTGLAAPTWQAISCDAGMLALPQSDLGNQDYAERDGAAVLAINGDLIVFFDVMDNFNTGTLAHGGQIWYAKWNGTSFDTVVFFFDSAGGTVFPNQTNPTGQATVFVLSMMPTQKADGSWTLMVSTSFDHPQRGSQYNEIIFTRVSALAVTCPVGGSTATIGIFYTATIVPTGGVGPFTFAIIAGALPPGLTLNATSGVINGFPTTVGTYNYTIQVTDSLGATATVSCQIVVAKSPCPSAFVPAGNGV